MEPLVTVIMAAYNAERYIAAAVDSVLRQSHHNWELMVVNDGSTDSTARILAGYTDPRIKVFHKPNGGIGSARNLGLSHATGEFLCCLDADDVLPAKSIEARLRVFASDPALDIVDGKVLFMNEDLSAVLKEYAPDFRGNPFHELVSFSGRCFMGPSWMVRSGEGQVPRFEERISHAEDLLFCLVYSKERLLGCTSEITLHYRRSGNSSMTKNLAGMERSFRYIEGELASTGLATPSEVKLFRTKYRRIMMGTYWKARRYGQAFRIWMR